MKPQTTTSAEITTCPACEKAIAAELAYDVTLEPAYPEGHTPPALDRTATATLTVVGLRVSHDCMPKPQPRYAEGGMVPPGPVVGPRPANHRPVG